MPELCRPLTRLITQAWRALVRRPGASLAISTALLLVWQYFGYPDTYRGALDGWVGPWRYRPIASSLYWFATCAAMLLVIPLVVARLAWGRSLRELGFGLGDWRVGLTATGVAYAIMFPLVFLAAPSAEFRTTYPLDPNALRSHELFWVYEAGYASFFVGWEFLFRGFLLFTLEPAIGAAAIAVQMVPFALMHVGKPVAEALGSIVAGVFLGALAWRTRSIWYGVVIHAAVAITMDMIVYLRWGLAE